MADRRHVHGLIKLRPFRQIELFRNLTENVSRRDQHHLAGDRSIIQIFTIRIGTCIWAREWRFAVRDFQSRLGFVKRRNKRGDGECQARHEQGTHKYTQPVSAKTREELPQVNINIRRARLYARHASCSHFGLRAW